MRKEKMQKLSKEIKNMKNFKKKELEAIYIPQEQPTLLTMLLKQRTSNQRE